MYAFSRKLGIALAFSTLSLGAMASTYGGSCTDQPQAKWMTTGTVRAKFEGQGYTVGRIKTSGTCYEIYTKDKDGSKIELFVNPVDASVVGQAGKK